MGLFEQVQAIAEEELNYKGESAAIRSDRFKVCAL